MKTSGTRTQAPKVAVVLVHGSYHGAWCWEKVEPLLTSQGWDVRAIDLPLRSLSEDGAHVREAVALARAEADKVMLVGHSYGGFAISKGGHDADHLVFVAAAVPDAGDSVQDLAPRMGTPELAEAHVESADGSTVSVAPDRAAELFYNCCSDEDIAKARPRLRPRGTGTRQERIDEPAWRDVPASFVVCTQDHCERPDYQFERARLLGDYVVLDADHSPFFSAVEPLTERLSGLAGDLLAQATAEIEAAGAAASPTP